MDPDGQGFALGETLVAILGGTTQEVRLDFHPLTPGPKNATVSVRSLLGGEVTLVTVSGLAVPASAVELGFSSNVLSLSPGSMIQLPRAAVQATTSLPFSISNLGRFEAEQVVVTSVGEGFDVSPQGAAALPPGESLDYVITFNPAKSGLHRGILQVSGANFLGYAFILEGDAFLDGLQIEAWGTTDQVEPRQLNPYPTVGLQLSEPALESVEGILEIYLDSGKMPPDPSVRFLQTGKSIAFKFLSDRTRAIFPSEGGQELAQYQSGTVAGHIRFLVTMLRTIDGTEIPMPGGPAVGSTEVQRLEPRIIDTLACARTAEGVDVTLRAYSTIRQINGVDVDLTAAAETQLSFPKPDETFANEAFSAWFNDTDSDRFGGAFALTIPIAVSDIRTLGSVSVRLRNEIGWSNEAEISSSLCSR